MKPTSRAPASIVDVARRAGVSPSTVSRSLRGLEHVAEPTRERVLRAASELSYVVSPAASRLASGRTSTVGVVVPLVSRWFFAELMAGAEVALGAAGYDLLLYSLGDVDRRNRFFDRLPLRRRVDAVLILCVQLDHRERAALQELGLPVAVIGGGAEERVAGFASVRIDDVQATSMAVRHLVNLGHERIGMISGSEEDPLGFTTSMERRAAYEVALAGAGIDSLPDHVATAEWGFEGGSQAMEQLLSASELPSAVFAESDEMAFGALRTLRRAGLRVPADMSIVGFDDHEFATVVDLTTVFQPVRAQGETAATMLLDALDGRSAAGGEVVLPTRLVVRGSTGRPPANGRARSGQRNRGHSAADPDS